jgi:hypothetical protein
MKTKQPHVGSKCQPRAATDFAVCAGFPDTADQSPFVYPNVTPSFLSSFLSSSSLACQAQHYSIS